MYKLGIYKGLNSCFARGWDGDFYLISDQLEPGLHEVTHFGEDLMIQGYKLEVPAAVYRKIFPQTREYIRITRGPQ